jgi:hypothetical protein
VDGFVVEDQVVAVCHFFGEEGPSYRFKYRLSCLLSTDLRKLESMLITRHPLRERQCSSLLCFPSFLDSDIVLSQAFPSNEVLSWTSISRLNFYDEGEVFEVGLMRVFSMGEELAKGLLGSTLGTRIFSLAFAYFNFFGSHWLFHDNTHFYRCLLLQVV